MLAPKLHERFISKDISIQNIVSAKRLSTDQSTSTLFMEEKGAEPSTKNDEAIEKPRNRFPHFPKSAMSLKQEPGPTHQRITYQQIGSLPIAGSSTLNALNSSWVAASANKQKLKRGQNRYYIKQTYDNPNLGNIY